MKNPSLSIIVPVYNVKSYIDRCLLSILNQSYSDFELVIIDDGSTDGSASLLDNYAAKDSRIIVIHQKNTGVSSARNTALKIFKGSYVTFVDPDDFIASDTYKNNMKFLLDNPDIDILQYPYCIYIDEEHPKNLVCHKEQLIVENKSIFSAWWSGTPLEYVIWNKISRKEMWKNVTFFEGHVSEDTRLVATFCQRANKVYISEVGLYYYQRERYGSYTYNYSFDKHIDLFSAHNAIFQIFKLYPTMVTEKVLAFTRLYYRLIQAKKESPDADINFQQEQITANFPSYNEIYNSVGTNKLWLYTAKLLRVKSFMRLFLYYLKIKQSILIC